MKNYTLQAELILAIREDSGKYPQEYKSALEYPRGGIARSVDALVRKGFIEPDPERGGYPTGRLELTAKGNACGCLVRYKAWEFTVMTRRVEPAEDGSDRGDAGLDGATVWWRIAGDNKWYRSPEKSIRGTKSYLDRCAVVDAGVGWPP
jgi:hypothetical protein